MEKYERIDEADLFENIKPKMPIITLEEDTINFVRKWNFKDLPELISYLNKFELREL